MFCMCLGAHVHASERGQFAGAGSPSTLCVLGIELRSLRLAASTFDYLASSEPLTLDVLCLVITFMWFSFFAHI